LSLRFDVPPAGLPGSPTATLRVGLLAVGTGTLPPLTVSYRRLARPQTLGSPTSMTDTAVTLPSSQVATTGYLRFEAETAPFAVAAGDTVVVQVVRGAADGYAGDLGVYRFGLVIPS